MLFDLLARERAYYSRPIALRHPIVFYEGHLPAFSFNTLVKKALGRPSIDPRLETLFARGIDPHEAAGRPKGGSRDVAGHGTRRRWPARDEVHAFAAEADRRVLDALCRADLERPAIRCSIARKRCSRSSSTKRCIRRRCSTCGIACRSRRSIGPPITRRASVGRGRPGSEWVEIPPGARHARRRSRVDAVRLGQRVSAAPSSTSTPSRSSAST